MTDPLDLEAIKERVAQLWPTAEYVDDDIADAGADCRALISEVERLRADVERKDEALRFYADHSYRNWLADEGKRARAVLSESTTEEGE